MRLYCEFRDKYGDDPRIVEGLEYKIPDRRFHQYYLYYGTKGCSARKFREIDLDRGWNDVLNDDKLRKMIYSEFKVGDRITSKEAKEKIIRIYDNLNILKKAKANDLEQYFKLTPTKITMPDKSLKPGFKLGELEHE